jgi:hypothetical protein
MAISFRKYVDITSGVGGGAAVRERDLITRCFTENPLLPTGTQAEFDFPEDVGTYFGTDSEEYARAVFYFGWISKLITRAKKISFARWTPDAVAPRIYGATAEYALAQFTGIANGSVTLTLGGETENLTAIDFTGAASLAAVAALIEDKIQANVSGGAVWTAATVTYDATRGSFNVLGGAVGAAAVAVAAGVGGTDISGLIGWRDPAAILSAGAAAQTVTEVLDASAGASNNFATFLFMPALTADDVEEAATWANLQNVMFVFLLRTVQADASGYFTALASLAGTAMTLAPDAGEFDEMVPGIILAATDYSKRNSVQNYMFQMFALTAKVTTTTLSNQLDVLRCNYYGQTQTAGQLLEFYQRGTMMGPTTAPVDQNTFANEIWLKDAAGAAIMALLLALARVSANTTGRAQLIATLSDVVQRALNNGTISVGKTLSQQQKLFITELTGDELAWHQVQNDGYWFDVAFQTVVTEDDRTEYKAVYTLIYSKDDTIRKVEGTHVLI